MNIGTKIRDLRKSMKFTQEQLANAVGVSVPAVSKWETNTTIPDVTLLAPIARKLETDVNNLLSFHGQISDWEVVKIVKELEIYFSNNNYFTSVAHAFKEIQKYPNNNYLKLNIANRSIVHSENHSFDLQQDKLSKVIGRCETLLLDIYSNPSPDDNPVINTVALSTLVSQYIKTDRLKEAEQLLIELPETTSNGRELLKKVFLLQGNLIDAKMITQREFLVDRFSIMADIEVLYNVELENGHFDKAIEIASDYH